MKRSLLFLPLLLSFVFAQDKPQISRIAFGSCSHQDKDQPILWKVADKDPDLFIYLGDNIYGDTEDMAILREKYGDLGAKPEFQNLRETAEIQAVWDDHDYGINDGGRHYPKKAESKAIFLDFWKEPETSTRFKHEGIYHSIFYGQGENRLQLILLDTRTFRDDLIWREKGDEGTKHDYKPNPSPDSTMLGEAQWAWLEQQFNKPAAVRLIATSTQFSHQYNGYESWTNVPHEQQRMIDLIAKTNANGVIFISGDVHWGELSARPTKAYTLYDVTSSGLTQRWGSTEPNRYRIGRVIRKNNFGMIEIDWEARKMHLQLYNKKGKRKVGHWVKFSELGF